MTAAAAPMLIVPRRGPSYARRAVCYAVALGLAVAGADLAQALAEMAGAGRDGAVLRQATVAVALAVYLAAAAVNGAGRARDAGQGWIQLTLAGLLTAPVIALDAWFTPGQVLAQAGPGALGAMIFLSLLALVLWTLHVARFANLERRL